MGSEVAAVETLQQPLLEATKSEVDFRMESVLKDNHLSYFRRIYLAALMEMKFLFHLAAPAIFVYVINNGMSMLTRIFAGRMGSMKLAAASLGNSGFNMFTFGLMVLYYLNFLFKYKFKSSSNKLKNPEKLMNLMK